MPLIVQTVAEASATQSGTLTSGSAVVTNLSNTALLTGAVSVSGTGVPLNTFVASIDSATQLTLSQNATASGTQSLAFSLEPVTLAQAKSQLTLDASFTTDDAYIAALITAARRLAEAYSKTTCLSTTFDSVWDAFPFGGGYFNRQLRQFYGAFPGAMGATFPGFLPTNTGILELPRYPLQSITSITYLDTDGSSKTLDPSVYVVTTGSPGRVAPAYGHIWPVTLPQIGAVTVRLVAGYGDTADKVPLNVRQAILLLVSHLYLNRGETPAELPPAVEALMGIETHGGYL